MLTKTKIETDLTESLIIGGGWYGYFPDQEMFLKLPLYCLSELRHIEIEIQELFDVYKKMNLPHPRIWAVSATFDPKYKTVVYEYSEQC